MGQECFLLGSAKLKLENRDSQPAAAGRHRQINYGEEGQLAGMDPERALEDGRSGQRVLEGLQAVLKGTPR